MTADRPRVPPGYRIACYDRLDSTSTEARRLADAGEVGPLWIWAKEQTSGYGRRGRSWASNPGDLACTLLTPSPPSEQARLYSFIAALAVGDFLASHVLADRIVQKWPNDVLCDRKKIVGVLLERLEAASGAVLTVGIGLNLVSNPPADATPYATTHLRALTKTAPPSPQDALSAIAGHWRDWLALFQEKGFEVIRAAWLERADEIGHPLSVKAADRVVRGAFDGVDEGGALLIQDESGARVRLSAGDVFF